jgi:hypothetical protein
VNSFRRSWLPLVVLFAAAAAVPIGLLFPGGRTEAGPRPCEVAAKIGDPDPATIRMVAASQVQAGHLVLTGSNAVGVVVERSAPPADAQDQTPAVRVLIVRAGGGANAAGEVATLGGMETVVDLGPLSVRVPAADAGQ